MMREVTRLPLTAHIIFAIIEISVEALALSEAGVGLRNRIASSPVRLTFLSCRWPGVWDAEVVVSEDDMVME
jgi:hypothetical protein